ncbi:MAG: bifunctional 5,10-methylenetetrahydrofolate dehydrogenase/5,10-methenyltetrahydrofolate cyclohydrolase [bacterium]|nr:bifunctional 5,10-methylenetetrahydrofolate dehydrogenase/5,10-methenyltetrahydrofolate cyclohydrolase [bacterium]
MIIDGRAIAESLYSDLAARRARIEGAVRLGIVVGGSNPVIESFIRIKARAAARLNVELVRRDLQLSAETADAIALIEQISSGSDGVIVQLPLPKEIDTQRVLSAIPPSYDVDAINPVSESERAVHAPVAEAVREILARSHVNAAGMHAVVVGQGRLVGAPCAALLKRLGAEVSVVTNEHGSLEELKKADIVVLGAGNPGFIKPEHLKSGVVLIDAGTSESGGKILGDADPSCAEKASVFTPVPGGVGPIAVAMIFKNLFDLVDAAKK